MTKKVARKIPAAVSYPLQKVSCLVGFDCVIWSLDSAGPGLFGNVGSFLRASQHPEDLAISRNAAVTGPLAREPRGNRLSSSLPGVLHLGLGHQNSELLTSEPYKQSGGGGGTEFKLDPI